MRPKLSGVVIFLPSQALRILHVYPNARNVSFETFTVANLRYQLR